MRPGRVRVARMEDNIPARLLTERPEPNEQGGGFFKTLLKCIESARRTIELHVYVWRSDEVGNAIGQALLRAAQRGVSVSIVKDYGAMLFEHLEMNGKAYVHSPHSTVRRGWYRFLSRCLCLAPAPDGFAPNAGSELAAHPNVTFAFVNRTHTKYFLFDDERLILGSVNIEDRHRQYFDYALEFADPALISRFHTLSPAPPGQPEFVVNRFVDGWRRFDVKPTLMQLIDAARCEVQVEMAYLGDRDVTRCLARAAGRGVRISLLMSRHANVGNALNYRTAHRLQRVTNVQVALSSRMVHSKLVIVDHEQAVVGSANFSVFSLQRAEELCIWLKPGDRSVATLAVEFIRRWGQAEAVTDTLVLSRHSKAIAAVQYAVQVVNPN